MKTTLLNAKKSIASKQYLLELYYYKDLLFSLVKRDINVVYKQTVLGFAWAVIRPAIQMVLFTVIFGKLAQIGNDIKGIPYAIFSFSALVPWAYFSASMTASTNSLISSEQFLTKIYFPRIIIPLTPILSKLIDFIISLIVLFALMYYYNYYITIKILILPILIFIMVIFSLGISLWLSALAIQYRDVNQVIQFLGQILMYMAPVIWPITYIPEAYRTLYGIYPMVGVIEGFRAVFIPDYPISWGIIGVGTIISLIIFFSGLIFFRSKEDIFADVI